MSEHVNKYTEYEARTKAIETLLYERGLITPAAVDRVVSYYENEIGPMGGAKVVAKSWVDPEYRKWLEEDATAAMASLGYAGEQAHQISAVFNDSQTHHVVVCTLCSCYPWPVLGLPPAWYKSMEYRSRVVADPRGVLKRDFGFDIPMRWRSGFGTAAPKSATSSSRNGRPAPTVGPRTSWRSW